MGGSNDSDFTLSRSHRPHIDVIIIFNVFCHEQQLLVIAVKFKMYIFSIFFLENGSTKLV